MKIYIVRVDDEIEEIFVSKNKAEEYKEWTGSSNVTIEERETGDELILHKNHIVFTQLICYNSGKKELTCSNYKTTGTYEGNIYFSDFNHIRKNYYVITMSKVIEDKKWNESLYADESIKEIYQISKRIDKLKNDGLNEKEINEVINNDCKNDAIREIISDKLEKEYKDKVKLKDIDYCLSLVQSETTKEELKELLTKKSVKE